MNQTSKLGAAESEWDRVGWPSILLTQAVSAWKQWNMCSSHDAFFPLWPPPTHPVSYGHWTHMPLWTWVRFRVSGCKIRRLNSSLNTQQHPRSSGHTWKVYVSQRGKTVSTWIRKIIANKYQFCDGVTALSKLSDILKWLWKTKDQQAAADRLETGENFNVWRKK